MDLESRITDLEIRFAHQDALLESLNREVVEQRQLIERQTKIIEVLSQRLREAEPAAVGRLEDEPPPPHY